MQTVMSLDVVAELADRIQDAITPYSQVTTVNVPAIVTSITPTVLCAEYHALDAKVDMLCS